MDLKELLNYNEEEDIGVHMPNEVFKDLKNNLSRSNHIAFTYSFLYLSVYLYRYTKYSLPTKFTLKELKKILGCYEDSRPINAIVKKKGLLDELGYTETTSNYPISWDLDEDNCPVFTLVKDLSDNIARKIDIHKQLYVKNPLFATNRDNGLFYMKYKFHNPSVSVFFKCLETEDLGTLAFYIYSYLKCKTDLYKLGFKHSLDQIVSETGVKKTSLVSTLQALEFHDLIEIRRDTSKNAENPMYKDSNMYSILR